MQERPAPRLIMLDFDGVVVDSLDAWSEATVAGLAAHGFDHLARPEWVLEMLEDNWFDGLVRAGVPADVIHEIDERFAALMKTADIPAYPGMADVVGRLGELHRVVLITSNRTDLVEELLSRHHIDGVSEVLGGDKEPSKVVKIGSAVAESGTSDAWFVGDTTGDIVEGRQAGVRTVATTWGWHSEAQLVKAGPDHVVRSALELLRLLS